MENFALSSSSLPLISSINPKTGVFRSPYTPFLLRRPYLFSANGKRGRNLPRRSVIAAAAGNGGSSRISCENDSHRLEIFGSISSSSGGRETTSVGVSPQYPNPPPPSQIGSPLFWVGVGVALSALFSWAATGLKKYAMQQAFKTMMGQMASQNSPFNNSAFSASPPFPFPPATSPSASATPPASAFSSMPVVSEPVTTVDVIANNVESPPAEEVKLDAEKKEETKRYEFVDVSAEELVEKQSVQSSDASSMKEVHFAEPVLNGSVPRQGATKEDYTSNKRKPGSVLSVEALEKMMEDPTVQKMVYPYLPEEMRNPATFKWMLQNPQYRQQLEDMLNNMGGSNSAWDNQLMDSLKNFDLSSPEVKQQFDQIGLTPEEVISKIMANPEVAMAFQNPRVQAAIMDCSQNPLSITKYQNDKEVMDVFNKISELFPGMGGPL
ncbi:protein TIC 40, chloroplastic [Nymphaea colorata]|nr:protein TIC 40, chloroplastic [Nymphaea colorata]